MTPQQIRRARLYNQHIIASRCKTPAEVVGHLGAVQAQDYAGTKWAIGLRLPGSTDAEIEAAVTRGEIIRSWPMRGTLHFMVPEDVRWITNALAPRVIRRAQQRYSQLGLDEATLEKGITILEHALAGGHHCTRAELMELLEAHGISTKDQRGYHIVGNGAMQARICVGPMRGKQQTFALLDEWAPTAATLDPEESLVRITQRYFASHGPATIKDFMWWTGLTSSEVKRALSQTDLISMTVDGAEYWLPHTMHIPSVTAPAQLLPGFDEYMLGYTDRSLALENNAHYVPPKNGMFANTIVIDGRVVGVWRRTRKSKTVVMELTLFQTLSAAQRSQVITASESYSTFLGLEPVVQGIS